MIEGIEGLDTAAATVPKPPPELLFPAPLVVMGETPACVANKSV
jgi:hypothetical protein